MEHICFPNQVGASTEDYDGESLLCMNERLQLDMTDRDLAVIITAP